MGSIAQFVGRSVFILLLGAAEAIVAMYVARWLFTVNAPNADRIVKEGWGFNLYAAFVSGGVTGILAAVGLILRRSAYSIWTGLLTAGILLWRTPTLSRNDFWEGPDLVATALLASAWLVWFGFRLKSKGR